MRYAIIPTGISVLDAEAEVRKVGGTNITVRPIVRQVYCNMDPGQASTLARFPGLTVKPVTKVTTDQITAAPV